MWSKKEMQWGQLLTGIILGLSLVSMHVNANEVSAAVVTESEPAPDLITPEEIQQGLKDMQHKMNSRIERWGAGLTRHDFERVRGQMVLKQNKRIQVCQIFQSVIDETYQSAQANKHRLAPQDQKVVENRNSFIRALGIKNNIIPTKLGFDCRMK